MTKFAQDIRCGELVKYQEKPGGPYQFIAVIGTTNGGYFSQKGKLQSLNPLRKGQEYAVPMTLDMINDMLMDVGVQPVRIKLNPSLQAVLEQAQARLLGLTNLDKKPPKEYAQALEGIDEIHTNRAFIRNIPKGGYTGQLLLGF